MLTVPPLECSAILGPLRVGTGFPPQQQQGSPPRLKRQQQDWEDRRLYFSEASYMNKINKNSQISKSHFLNMWYPLMAYLFY